MPLRGAWRQVGEAGITVACSFVCDSKDISQLRLSLLLNSAMCHLKENDPARTVEVPLRV